MKLSTSMPMCKTTVFHQLPPTTCTHAILSCKILSSGNQTEWFHTPEDKTHESLL